MITFVDKVHEITDMRIKNILTVTATNHKYGV